MGEESRAAALRAAVQQGPQGRTLVFANTLATAEAAEAELQGVRTCAAFHNGPPPPLPLSLPPLRPCPRLSPARRNRRGMWIGTLSPAGCARVSSRR